MSKSKITSLPVILKKNKRKQKPVKKKTIIKASKPKVNVNKETTKKAKKILNKSELTPKQKKFCREYIYDWNATRSYLKAYPRIKNADVAAVCASQLLRNPKVAKYIEEIQEDLEKLAGISRMKVIREHMKLAFSSIAHLHNTWIERREFEALTEDQKSCISEISTQIRNVSTENNADEDTGEVTKKTIAVEFVKIKLYDKQKALDSISKMLGYDAPTKTEVTGKDGKDLIPPARILTKEEAKVFLNKIDNEC